MKDRVQIFNELKDILEGELCLWEVSTLDLHMSLRRDLDLDSQDILSMLHNIETHFNVSLSLTHFKKCETVKDVVDYIFNTQHVNGSEN